MLVFIESLLVGLYTFIIFLFVRRLNFFTNPYILILITGFCKHFFGYWLNIWTFYCKICLDSRKAYANIKLQDLLVEAVKESILFLVVGCLFVNKIQIGWLFFLIGFNLHLFFDYGTNIHRDFCANKCKKRVY
jgi:hypothetical protein